MAWNPSPEVAAARDFGEKFGDDQVIILRVNYTTRQMGYASWGKTRALCDDAERLAELAYESVHRGIKQ